MADKSASSKDILNYSVALYGEASSLYKARLTDRDVESLRTRMGSIDGRLASEVEAYEKLYDRLMNEIDLGYEMDDAGARRVLDLTTELVNAGMNMGSSLAEAHAISNLTGDALPPNVIEAGSYLNRGELFEDLLADDQIPQNIRNWFASDVMPRTMAKYAERQANNDQIQRDAAEKITHTLRGQVVLNEKRIAEIDAEIAATPTGNLGVVSEKTRSEREKLIEDNNRITKDLFNNTVLRGARAYGAATVVDVLNNDQIITARSAEVSARSAESFASPAVSRGEDARFIQARYEQDAPQQQTTRTVRREQLETVGRGSAGDDYEYREPTDRIPGGIAPLPKQPDSGIIMFQQRPAAPAPVQTPAPAPASQGEAQTGSGESSSGESSSGEGDKTGSGTPPADQLPPAPGPTTAEPVPQEAFDAFAPNQQINYASVFTKLSDKAVYDRPVNVLEILTELGLSSRADYDPGRAFPALKPVLEANGIQLDETLDLRVLRDNSPETLAERTALIEKLKVISRAAALYNAYPIQADADPKKILADYAAAKYGDVDSAVTTAGQSLAATNVNTGDGPVSNEEGFDEFLARLAIGGAVLAAVGPSAVKFVRARQLGFEKRKLNREGKDLDKRVAEFDAEVQKRIDDGNPMTDAEIKAKKDAFQVERDALDVKKADLQARIDYNKKLIRNLIKDGYARFKNGNTPRAGITPGSLNLGPVIPLTPEEQFDADLKKAVSILRDPADQTQLIDEAKLNHARALDQIDADLEAAKSALVAKEARVPASVKKQIALDVTNELKDRVDANEKLKNSVHQLNNAGVAEDIAKTLEKMGRLPPDVAFNADLQKEYATLSSGGTLTDEQQERKVNVQEQLKEQNQKFAALKADVIKAITDGAAAEDQAIADDAVRLKKEKTQAYLGPKQAGYDADHAQKIAALEQEAEAKRTALLTDTVNDLTVKANDLHKVRVVDYNNRIGAAITALVDADKLAIDTLKADVAANPTDTVKAASLAQQEARHADFVKYISDIESRSPQLPDGTPDLFGAYEDERKYLAGYDNELEDFHDDAARRLRQTQHDLNAYELIRTGKMNKAAKAKIDPEFNVKAVQNLWKTDKALFAQTVDDLTARRDSLLTEQAKIVSGKEEHRLRAEAFDRVVDGFDPTLKVGLPPSTLTLINPVPIKPPVNPADMWDNKGRKIEIGDDVTFRDVMDVERTYKVSDIKLVDDKPHLIVDVPGDHNKHIFTQDFIDQPAVGLLSATAETEGRTATKPLPVDVPAGLPSVGITPRDASYKALKPDFSSENIIYDSNGHVIFGVDQIELLESDGTVHAIPIKEYVQGDKGIGLAYEDARGQERVIFQSDIDDGRAFFLSDGANSGYVPSRAPVGAPGGPSTDLTRFPMTENHARKMAISQELNAAILEEQFKIGDALISARDNNGTPEALAKAKADYAAALDLSRHTRSLNRGAILQGPSLDVLFAESRPKIEAELKLASQYAATDLQTHVNDKGLIESAAVKIKNGTPALTPVEVSAVSRYMDLPHKRFSNAERQAASVEVVKSYQAVGQRIVAPVVRQQRLLTAFDNFIPTLKTLNLTEDGKLAAERLEKERTERETRRIRSLADAVEGGDPNTLASLLTLDEARNAGVDRLRAQTTSNNDGPPDNSQYTENREAPPKSSPRVFENADDVRKARADLNADTRLAAKRIAQLPSAERAVAIDTLSKHIAEADSIITDAEKEHGIKSKSRNLETEVERAKLSARMNKVADQTGLTKAWNYVKAGDEFGPMSTMLDRAKIVDRAMGKGLVPFSILTTAGSGLVYLKGDSSITNQNYANAAHAVSFMVESTATAWDIRDAMKHSKQMRASNAFGDVAKEGARQVVETTDEAAVAAAKAAGQKVVEKAGETVVQKAAEKTGETVVQKVGEKTAEAVGKVIVAEVVTETTQDAVEQGAVKALPLEKAAAWRGSAGASFTGGQLTKAIAAKAAPSLIVGGAITTAEVFIALDARDGYKAAETTIVGGMATAGGAIGATAGSFIPIPIIGTAVGGVVGGVVGAGVGVVTVNTGIDEDLGTHYTNMIYYGKNGLVAKVEAIKGPRSKAIDSYYSKYAQEQQKKAQDPSTQLTANKLTAAQTQELQDLKRDVTRELQNLQRSEQGMAMASESSQISEGLRGDSKRNLAKNLEMQEVLAVKQARIKELERSGAVVVAGAKGNEAAAKDMKPAWQIQGWWNNQSNWSKKIAEITEQLDSGKKKEWGKYKWLTEQDRQKLESELTSVKEEIEDRRKNLYIERANNRLDAKESAELNNVEAMLKRINGTDGKPSLEDRTGRGAFHAEQKSQHGAVESFAATYAKNISGLDKINLFNAYTQSADQKAMERAFASYGGSSGGPGPTDALRDNLKRG